MDAEEMDEELLESISNTEPSLTGLCDQYLNAKSENPMFNTEQPWILDFASSLLDCCRYGESDCLYHPIGVILVVSSTGSDPIRRFDELSAAHPPEEGIPTADVLEIDSLLLLAVAQRRFADQP